MAWRAHFPHSAPSPTILIRSSCERAMPEGNLQEDVTMGNPVLINTKLTESRGKPRVWIEGAHIARAGIEPGQVLKVRFIEKDRLVEASSTSEDFDFEVRVSKRTTRSGTVRPLLELRHERLVELFGDNATLRVVVREGKIVIRLHHINKRAEERVTRLRDRIQNGEPLTIGSLFHGGGTLDSAFHCGMAEAGIQTVTKVVNEVETSFLSASIENNSHLFNEDTLFIDAPIETIDLRSPGQLDLVLAGVPCTGASLSGRAKGKLKFAKWEKDRRFVVSRVLKPEKERAQLSLLEGSEYDYFFFVTNTTLLSEKVVIYYEKRGNAENYIKEAKYDMAVGHLLLKSFWANEAVFQMMMLSYNLFLLFKFDSLDSSEYRQQIKTFRLKYVFLAAKIIKTARYVIMKLSENYPYKGVYEKCLV